MVVQHKAIFTIGPASNAGTTPLSSNWPALANPQYFPPTRPTTEAKQISPQISFYLAGRQLITAYAAFVEQFMQPYAGADEMPAFEPEDYPVR